MIDKDSSLDKAFFGFLLWSLTTSIICSISGTTPIKGSVASSNDTNGSFSKPRIGGSFRRGSPPMSEKRQAFVDLWAISIIKSTDEQVPRSFNSPFVMQNVIKQYSSIERKSKRSMEWSDHSNDWLRIKREHRLCDNPIFFLHSHFIEQDSLSHFSTSLIESLTNKTGSEAKGISSRCLLGNSYCPLQTSPWSTHKTAFVSFPEGY